MFLCCCDKGIMLVWDALKRTFIFSTTIASIDTIIKAIYIFVLVFHCSLTTIIQGIGRDGVSGLFINPFLS